MGNSEIRRGGLVVRPADLDQVAEWMFSCLRGRDFEVISYEEEFNYEPLKLEACRLDERTFPCVKFDSGKMVIAFYLLGPEDVLVPVGGFGKLIIDFHQAGFTVDNKGIGKWEFMVVKKEK